MIYVVHENWGEGSGNLFFYFYIFTISFCSSLSAITKVTLTEDELIISKLLPFTKPRHIPLDQITAYDHKKSFFTRKYTVGKITPSEGRQVHIRSNGTKNFTELDSLLSEKFPPLA